MAKDKKFKPTSKTDMGDIYEHPSFGHISIGRSRRAL